ncbi:hypothetical protein B0J18DRAFT_212304 [Chaetomium sp. MPI-SDFR-AT-0129]|nr:hypothetical protein B0J18DRAFT_212304 [Chaetomium sp. MPI-SDFR-AT-0129]
MATLVNEKGFTVLYEAPQAAVDLVFVHGFTGHPKDTWTLKLKKQRKNLAKRHGEDDEVGDGARPSKRLRMPSFGRRPSTLHSTVASAPASPGSSRIPTVDGTNGRAQAGSEGQRPKEIYWPADLACQTIPNSRILTYGYDTNVRNWFQGPVSRKTIYDHAWDMLYSLEAFRRDPNVARRPIVFIAHSLGGIVVKEALRSAQACQPLKPHIYGILKATSSIIFFGTPHGGADPRNVFHHILAASYQACGGQVNPQIVNALMPDSERLKELREEFPVICQAQGWALYSFQEEYGVKALFGTTVVKDQSSCLNIPTLETRQFISSNHMDMCRFPGLQDPEYIKVAAAMGRIMETIETRSQATPAIDSERINRGLSVVENEHLPPAQEARYQGWGAAESITQETKSALIEQLYFTKIDERLTNLTTAQGKTCRWFLSKPEYTSWRNPANQPDNGGFLWIRGHPGTGKSILMKFLFEDVKSKIKHDASQIVLSFFFLARGELDEKSTPGLYRSLLHQLFQMAPDLKDSLEWMTADGARGIQTNGWNEEALKRTLHHAILKLGSRRLTIFVDALDECDDNQAKDMVFFFEELCDSAQESQVRLDICFSSRHYPLITIKKGTELTLEDQVGHKEDIQSYIKAKLRLKNTKAAQTLQAEILEKSSLIFLWVALVVDILNSEYPGKPIEKMRQRLEEIPPKLADLFEMILTRDEEDPKLLKICLQWILFATRPLKPQELYFAVQFGLKEGPCSGRWDREAMDLDEMKAFVRHSSKGLAGVTRGKSSEVQFIHESVRDFLLGKSGASQWSGAIFSGNFEGQSHEVLKDCCLAQLETDMDLKPSESYPSKESFEAVQTQLRADLPLRFPLLEYSLRNILQHANSAQRHGVGQRAFLEKFPLQKWAAVHDVLEKHAVRQYSQSVNLRYILAQKNLADLIKLHPQTQSCFDVVAGARYGPPIFAALTTGSTEAVWALLEAEVEAQPVEFQGRLWEHCKLEFETRKQLGNFGGPSFVFSKAKGVINHLVDHDHELLDSFWLNLGRVPFIDGGRRAMWKTVCGGHTAAVKTLLGMGAQVDCRDVNGVTPLAWAAQNGHSALVKLLLDTGKVEIVLGIGKVDIDRKDIVFSQTPLFWAAQNGHDAVVKLLLDTGKVNIDSRDYNGQTPLFWAAQNGHDAVVKLLLDTGKVNIDSRDNNGQTPLAWATRNGHEAIVKLLKSK